MPKILPGLSEDEMHVHSPWSSARRVCKRAGISGLRFHDFRHEAASRLFEKGLNQFQVAAITGHKSLQRLQRYTHLKAVDLVDLLK